MSWLQRQDGVVNFLINIKHLVKPHIDKTFTLADAAAAFEYAEKEKPKGKVLLSI